MFVLVNLKAYDCDPVAVGRAAAEVAESAGEADVAVAPQAAHLDRVAATGVETWAQHVDPVDHGSHTGHQLAEAAADAGAAGTLVNHSERRLRLADVDGAVRAAERADLSTVVCANNSRQAAAAAALSPDAVALEPPELIGGETPVSEANPAVVTDAVEAVGGVDPEVAVFCGAGISTGEDVAAARELGTEGVLLASAVAKADDPAAVLSDLVSGA